MGLTYEQRQRIRAARDARRRAELVARYGKLGNEREREYSQRRRQREREQAQVAA